MWTLAALLILAFLALIAVTYYNAAQKVSQTIDTAVDTVVDTGVPRVLIEYDDGGELLIGTTTYTDEAGNNYAVLKTDHIYTGRQFAREFKTTPPLIGYGWRTPFRPGMVVRQVDSSSGLYPLNDHDIGQWLVFSLPSTQTTGAPPVTIKPEGGSAVTLPTAIQPYFTYMAHPVYAVDQLPPSTKKYTASLTPLGRLVGGKFEYSMQYPAVNGPGKHLFGVFHS